MGRSGKGRQNFFFFFFFCPGSKDYFENVWFHCTKDSCQNGKQKIIDGAHVYLCVWIFVLIFI